MGLKIGVCGGGQFGRNFIPLFQAHHDVEEVVLAEFFPERRAEMAERFGLKRSVATLDELCASDVDAIALFTQRWMHADQAIQALEAGKHVYSAVPAAITVDEMERLVRTVERTGLTYMLGETSYYYPCTLYCRKRFQDGDFGRFVFGEAEYLHDMSHGFYRAYQFSGGDEWKSTASFPPMLYPTHSVSMILSVTGERLTQVSCLGQVDQEGDGVFDADVSLWGNTFSNESALFRTSDGGMCRINEFRRVGVGAGSSVRMSMYGTLGSYEEQCNSKVWTTVERGDPTDVTELLATTGYKVSDLDRSDLDKDLVDEFFSGISRVHPAARLPKEFLGLHNGHLGSHQFLVLDFVEALVNGNVPPNNVWQAARYCLPGIMAHESAKQEGALLQIPDYGDGPKS